MDMLSNVHVEIVEQPMGKGLRFRYISEGRTAGSIQGERSTNEHRTFPSIKIHNYSGPAVAVVSCVTTDKPAKPHPHHLVGTNCTKGVCTVHINGSNEPIPFANIGIQCCTRKDIGRNLEERRSMNVDPFNTGHQTNFDSIDLTTVCLCFQVYASINGAMIGLNPVVSNAIVDKKVCSELSIVRLSRISGSVRGGDEVFLLCSKVKKEDIKVVFSHRLENGEYWEKEGSFSSTDVHKQYVVVFKTPSYCETDIKKPVDVNLYLMRPSDNAVGESKTFTYYPENPDPFGIKAKRKRLSQTAQPYFMPQFEMSTDLASLTNPQGGGMFARLPGLPVDSGKWNFSSFPAPVSQPASMIKREIPVHQARMNFYQASGSTAMTNPYTFTGKPGGRLSDAASSSGRLAPSSLLGKDFDIYKGNSNLFGTVSSSSSLLSSSALEMLVTPTSNTMLKSEPAVTSLVNSTFNHPNSSYLNSAALQNSLQPQNNFGLAGPSDQEFSFGDIDVLGAPSNFQDVFNEDVFKSMMPEEQKFMLSGVGTDLPDLTDEDLKIFAEFLHKGS